MIKLSSLIVTALFVFSVLGFSQTTPPNSPVQPNGNPTGPTDTPSRNGFWESNLSGGNYLVALSRITSVSRHKYVLDGTLIVDEVTIDTDGQALVRFYFISPVTDGLQGNAAAQLTQKVLELADGVAESAGSDIQNMVAKKYPLTTHSKTVEYRLLSGEDLSGLYSSVKTAWKTGKGRIFTGR